MLLLFFFFRYRRPNELPPSETTSPDEKSPEEREAEIAAIPHRVAKLALCGVCLAAYSSVELGWFNFSTTMWQFLPVDLDATQSNLMMSIVSGTFTLGRFLTGFIALRLSPDTILAYHLVTMAVGLGTLFLGRADQTFIIIGNALFGFGLSAMWPALFAFTERHLRLSDRVCSLYSFLAGFLSIMTPLILGSTFNAHPTALFLIEGINLTICAAAFITVKLWIERDNAIAKRNAKAEVSSHKVL